MTLPNTKMPRPFIQPGLSKLPSLSILLLQLCCIITPTTFSSPSDCTSFASNDDNIGECLHADTHDSDKQVNYHDLDVEQCLNASSFQRRITSFLDNVEDEHSILPLLRGTLDDVLSRQDLKTLVEWLDGSDFVAGAGYADNYVKDDQGGNSYNAKHTTNSGYAAPMGYSALGLNELSRARRATSTAAASSKQQQQQQANNDEQQHARYDHLLQIRSKIRNATEKALHLCSNTLFIEFTTISLKTEGGAHRPHADNCFHYFREVSPTSSFAASSSSPEGGKTTSTSTASLSSTAAETAIAGTKRIVTCDLNRPHPYPHRVASTILYLNDPVSGNFEGGQFYFAMRTKSANVGNVSNLGKLKEDFEELEEGNEFGENGFPVDEAAVEEDVGVQPGRMIYFTSGVENLHGALPVRKRKRNNNDGDDFGDEGESGTDARGVSENADDSNQPRRLVLAMRYVLDPSLEEYVPPFRPFPLTNEHKQSSLKTTSNYPPSNLKPRKIYDPNDPHSPKELFTLVIPPSHLLPIPTLLQSMGTYLVSQQNRPAIGSWQVNRYGKDSLHVIFKDHSAMFSIDFGIALDDSDDDNAKDEDKLTQTRSLEKVGTSFVKYTPESSIVIERHTNGKQLASLQYMLQESVLLHGVLDELSRIIMQTILNTMNTQVTEREESDKEMYFDFFKRKIEKAREALPARRA